MTFNSGRRDSFKKMILGGAAMGSLASFDFKEKEALALKGNINHGVCAWSMRPLSLEELCAQIKSVGVGAIDLIGPTNWELLKKFLSFLNFSDPKKCSLTLGENCLLTSYFLAISQSSLSLILSNDSINEASL